MCLFEDVDLALLTAGGVGDDEPRRQRICLQSSHVPSTLFQAGAHGSGNILHALRVLGCDIEILAEPVDQPMCLDRIATGKRQRVDTAHVEDIRKQATVQIREVHAASWTS
jgi:hypothetical protein